MFELRPYRRNNALYNPFREMNEMEKQLFGAPFGFFGENGMDAFNIDIKDEGDHFELDADLPGFDKKDIHLDVNGDTLTIHAERKAEQEEKDDKNNYVRCERSFGSYSRSFDVSGIDCANIKAAYKDGVLTLTLPKQKKEEPTGRRLEIE